MPPKAPEPPESARPGEPRRGARRVGLVLLLGGMAAGHLSLAWWRQGRFDGSLSVAAGYLGLFLLFALILPAMAMGIHLLLHRGRDLGEGEERR